MVLAVPMGRLADRFGRGRVLLGGYALLLAVYARCCRRWAAGRCSSLALGLLGALLRRDRRRARWRWAARVVPDEVRGSGLALLGTVTSIARLLASVAFGALWTLWGLAHRDRLLRRGARGGDRAGRGAVRPHAGAGAF